MKVEPCIPINVSRGFSQPVRANSRILPSYYATPYSLLNWNSAVKKWWRLSA